MKKVRIFDLKYDEKFRREFHEGVDQILDEGFLTNHTFVKKFEAGFAEFNNSKFATAVSSGTSAIEAACRAADVDGKYVLMPTNTFIATAVATKTAGGKPVALDVESTHFGICPERLHDAFKKYGKESIGAVIAVHIGGHVSDSFQEIIDICKGFETPLIEDCAHSHGAKFEDTVCGNLGEFGCYSLFTTKIMATGEGGIVTCNKQEQDDLLKSVRRFGMTLDNSIMHERSGNNLKMGEFQALMGTLELKRVNSRIEKRREIAKFYQENLKPELYTTVRDSEKSWGTYYKQITLPQTRTRSEIEDVAQKTGISLTGGVYFIPLHRQRALLSDYNDKDFPVANDFAERHFCPPCYPELDLDDIQYVCDVLNEI